MNSNHMDYVLQSCACANLRKVARTVTNVYDEYLQPSGLKSTQYYMLTNIARYKKVSISKLGEMMLLDQTTVTRNVNILKNSEFVHIKKDQQDSRAKLISLTDKGLAKLEEATPMWLQIQDKVEKDLGMEKYKDLLSLLTNLQESIK